MAIEDILRTLDEQAQAECDAVLEEAREHATLVVAEARSQAEQIHAGFARHVEQVAATEAAKRINSARLEAKMLVSSTKGNGVAETFERALAQLGIVRERGDYDALFAALAAEALEGVGGSVVVRVAPQDGRLAQTAADSAGVSATVDATLDTTGGLIVEANDGRVIRRNTLEDRLARARRAVQADVAKTLLS